MHTVSSFISELARAAGSSARMRDMIAAEAQMEVSAPMVSMWKRRGIPWKIHDPMRRVCAQVGVPADPVAWRNTEDLTPPAKQQRKSGNAKVAA